MGSRRALFIGLSKPLPWLTRIVKGAQGTGSSMKVNGKNQMVCRAEENRGAVACWGS